MSNARIFAKILKKKRVLLMLRLYSEECPRALAFPEFLIYVSLFGNFFWLAEKKNAFDAAFLKVKQLFENFSLIL
jgi:hypothetical protein